MSGLVTGLQNQVQRFESACDLKKSRILTQYPAFCIDPLHGRNHTTFSSLDVSAIISSSLT